jgi:hypothetical protein
MNTMSGEPKNTEENEKDSSSENGRADACEEPPSLNNLGSMYEKGKEATSSRMAIRHRRAAVRP